MATFDIENNVFIKALTLNSQSSVLALSTAGKFVNRNISVQITAKNGSARTPATSITQNPEITLTTATGAIQASYTKTQSIMPSVTEGWVSTGTSGMITTAGNTSITLPASTATVTDNSITIQPGWFGATTALTVTSGSASTPATTIAKAPTISVATATGVVTARYNSSKSITPTVVAGWVSSGTAGTVSTTGNSTLTLPTAGVSVSGKTVNITPGWIGATTGYDVQTTSVTTSNSGISGSNFTNSIASWGNGYITEGSINGATFANIASNGTTYKDISDTTAAPILVSGDYLYINKGYTDNLRISLAKLIPDDASVLLADSHILSGYSAYNNNGVLIAGSIPTKDISDITISTDTIIVPSGYYATTATEIIDAGDYTAGVTLSSVTVTPSVTISNGSTYGFTTTEPSSGTYITVDPSANNPTYTATGTASIIEAGYLGLGNKNTSVTKTVAVAAGTNYYAPVITPTFSGGGLTVNTNTNTVSTNAVVTISATGTFASASTYGVTTTKPSGTDGTAFLSIDGIGAVTTTGVVTSSVKMTRAQVNYTNKAGVATTHTSATAVNATSTTTGTTARVVPTVTDDFAARYIPIVSTTFSGGGLTVSSTNAITTNMATTSTSNYYIDAVATITATRAQVNYNNAAGAIAAHSGATAIAVSRSNTSTSATRIYIPQAKFSTTRTSADLTYSITSRQLYSNSSDIFNNNIYFTATATMPQIYFTISTQQAGYVPNDYVLSPQTSSQFVDDRRYIQGVTLNKPASGEAKFYIEVPNGEGNDMIKFVFHVDPVGNVVVDNSNDNAFS